MDRVHLGVERACATPSLLGPGDRFGLVTNHTGVDASLRPSLDALRAAGVPVTALFGPEHGLHGTAQDGHGEAAATDPESGLPVFDTYDVDADGLAALVERSAVDALLFDIADVGVRCYTYAWTMYDLMEAARRTGRRFVVLDRPNPLTGLVCEGPVLDAAYASFVGRAAVPLRHGLTLGELARWFAAGPLAGVDLTVVALDGWRRDMDAAATGLPWVMPSVNLPTPDTAAVYPGTVLFEGTNAAEGRGTTRPFELVGAAYVDARWARALRAADLPGVVWRDAWFTPTHGRHAGTPVRGVQLHVTDFRAFRPVHTGVVMLSLLAELYPDDFAWLPPGPSGHRHVDLLWGGDGLRRAVAEGERPALPEPAHPAAWAGDALLYA